jgi:hypothetical protein
MWSTFPAMSNEHTRDRGNLFENLQKRKPSQPDLQGECNIGGVAYEIRAWRREDQLAISVAPPRGDHNTYPPDTFRGALEAAPAKPTRRNAKDAAKDAPVVPAWSGDITSDEATYTLKAFEKQGKGGTYLTLTFTRTEKAEPASEFEEPEATDE